MAAAAASDDAEVVKQMDAAAGFFKVLLVGTDKAERTEAEVEAKYRAMLADKKGYAGMSVRRRLFCVGAARRGRWRGPAPRRPLTVPPDAPAPPARRKSLSA